MWQSELYIDLCFLDPLALSPGAHSLLQMTQ